MSVKLYRHNKSGDVVAAIYKENDMGDKEYIRFDGSKILFDSGLVPKKFEEVYTPLPEAPKVGSTAWAVMMMEQGHYVYAPPFGEEHVFYIRDKKIYNKKHGYNAPILDIHATDWQLYEAPKPIKMENKVNTEAEKVSNVKQSEDKPKLSLVPTCVSEAWLRVTLYDDKKHYKIREVYSCLVDNQHSLNHQELEDYIQDLITFTSIEKVANAAEYGNTKYDRYNWKLGCKWSVYLDACLRHILAFLNGEKNDTESGHPHLAHAIMNLGILHYYVSNGIGENDLKLVDSTPKVQ